MIRPIRLLTHLILVFATFLFTYNWAAAQELELPVQEETPPEITTEALREALLNLLDEGSANPANAKTTADPDIPVAALDIMLEPLTLEDLMPEIAGWQALLIVAIENLAASELELFKYNAAKARVRANDPNTKAAPESTAPSPEKVALIDRITELRAVRTARADHLKHVLDSYESKGGDPADTQEIRAYMAAVGGVRVDTQSVQSTVLTLQEWAVSKGGGQRVIRHIITVISWAIFGLVLGWLVGRILNFGLGRIKLTSDLLRRFLSKWITRIGAILGLTMGFSEIGTNMTPILAGLGILGFILAFSLQNTISNFASGLLILFQKPFDTGDEVEAAGITGDVESVSLFSTHLSTAENKKVIIPNNMIWEDVVVNSTSAPTRRLSIDVEVNVVDHGLEEAESILLKVMKRNQDVLKDPEPALTLSAVTSESITFTCRPWVLTKDKDRIRWELVSEFGKNLSVVKGLTKSSNV